MACEVRRTAPPEPYHRQSSHPGRPEHACRECPPLASRREEQKQIAQLQRTDGQLGDQDQVSWLKKVQENARRPDLRRTGT